MIGDFFLSLSFTPVENDGFFTCINYRLKSNLILLRIDLIFLTFCNIQLSMYLSVCVVYTCTME